MEWLRAPLDWANSHEPTLWWLFAASMAMFLLSPLVVGWLVVQLPRNYFTAKRRRRARWLKRNPALQPILVIAKNLMGIALALAGLMMLVMPGQGLLTLATGLMLVDFPGKYRVERWLATRPPVWRAIEWLRRRAGREPLERPE